MDWRDVPSLQALRGFEAAARHGSLSAAARELNVTHAAIAQHVRRLEAHFGCALMMREGAGMRVSPEGQALADALVEGFGIVGAAATALLRRHEDRPLRIALTPSLAANWLMPRIGKLWAEHPGLELELIPSPDVVDLRAQNYDMALRYGRGPWTGVVCERLLDAAHAVVATPGLIARPITTLSDLAGYDPLTEANNADDLLWAEQNGLEIDRHAEERSIEMFANNIVRAGEFFLANPNETPFIPTWNRVHAADSSFLSDMRAAVKADSEDFA